MSQSAKHEAQLQPQPSASQPPKPKAPFDIDNYINPFVPRNPLYLLPPWLSYFFGYRPPRKDKPPHAQHRILHTTKLYISVLIGAFCGVAIIESVYLALPRLSGHVVPIVIASFGAAAILEYNTIESPLAQPRNLVFGHFFSALVAVCITKLFLHLPPERFEDLRWLAGALAVGVASLIMSFTKTVHPPAGATALLAATNVEIQDLGWWLLPLVLLASMLMLASALVLNNAAGRRFPVYWWTPVDLKALGEERRKERRAKDGKVDADVEKGSSSSATTDSTESEAEIQQKKNEDAISDSDTQVNNFHLRKESTRSGSHSHSLSHSQTMNLERTRTRTISFSSASRRPEITPESDDESEYESEAGKRRSMSRSSSRAAEREDRIVITKNRIIVPEWLEVNDWEDDVLRILMERLRDG